MPSNRSLAWWLLFAGCVRVHQAHPVADVPAPVPQVAPQVAVVPFDVASCRTRVSNIPLDRDGVSGAIATRAPAFRECLIGASAYIEEPFEAALEVTLSAVPGGEPAYNVVSSGVSDEAKQCIVKAAKDLRIGEAVGTDQKVPPGWPGAEKGETLVVSFPLAKAAMPIAAGSTDMESAEFALRGALPLTCWCYRTAMDAVPQPWEVDVALHVDRRADLSVLPKDGPLSPCIESALRTTGLPRGGARFTYRPALLNAYAKEASPTTPGALRWPQLMAMLEQRAANVRLVTGWRAMRASAVKRRIPAGARKRACDGLAEANQAVVTAVADDQTLTQEAINYAEGDGRVAPAETRALRDRLTELDKLAISAASTAKAEITECKRK